MTLVISCGSVMTVVVPWTSVAFANSRGVTRLDSRWMCASTKPGQTILPVMSYSTSPSYCPRPTISPFAHAMSHVRSSFENTLTYVAFFSTRSAFSRPEAASITRFLRSNFR